MTTIVLPAIAAQIGESATSIDERVASAVLEGLASHPKRLPPWLFYDEAGSRLFDEITERPEYYLTRTERAILAVHAAAMITQAARGQRLRITELGAGSADKTRLLLTAAVARQETVVYEPVDVSPSALEAARERIEREITGVMVAPRVMDYTHGLELEPVGVGERRLVLYIGSSIGNFEPEAAAQLLRRVRAELRPGDGLLLGVDLVKDEATLLAAYDDWAGVTADFNLNLLARLNRELGADFYLESFEHRAVWNEEKSRIEMHLESRIAQTVCLNGLVPDGLAADDLDSIGLDPDGLGFEVDFAEGESIHTESSYKYQPGQPEAMLAAAGFTPVESWTDPRGWFAVCLGRAG
jgi:dimethylhistidine N-methyltransferase